MRETHGTRNRWQRSDRTGSPRTDFYRYQVALIEGELAKLQTQSQDLNRQDPDLRTFVAEEFRKELQAIEGETYAEYVRSGLLNQELSPFLTGAPESETAA